MRCVELVLNVFYHLYRVTLKVKLNFLKFIKEINLLENN